MHSNTEQGTQRNTRTRKWAQKTKKTFDHVQIWRIPVFRESHVYLTVFLPEETTSDTSFFSVWAINPMTLKIGNPPNRLVTQLIEDTTTASLGTMKQRNSAKFTITGWLSNRTGTSVDDGKARGKDQTRLPVPNLPLCHWSRRPVKAVAWFARAVVNWRSRSVAKSA